MGREIKRVPVDFDWPLEKRWWGFENPEQKRCTCTINTKIVPDPDCGLCDGEGITVELIPPPEGEGWQVWETVSEGSPVTPVFPTKEALVDYLAANGDTWCQKRGENPPSREAAQAFVDGGWVPSMVMVGGQVFTGIDAAVELKK